MVNESQDDRTKSFIALTAGTLISQFKIVSKIGSGGMGEVYLAEDTRLKRQVALKFLPTHYVADQSLRERFTREAQAAAKLDHPNIVPIHEVGEFKGRPYFAMAHIEGKSLKEVIKQNKLTTPEAINLTMQICEGLQEAHEAGVVHRDIKPGNIIIDKKGKPRLLDFGLAMVSGEDKLTKTGSTLGTVGYMSPEQISGKNVDHRSDLFSVGVILYEMLTGKRPFEGDNDAAIVKAITDSTPEPVARFKSGVTGELQQIIDKVLSKDQSLRYQHADGMLTDLRRLQLVKSPHKKSMLALWITAASIIVIVGGYFGYSQWASNGVAKRPTRLVVLPFDNSGPEDQAYFASGVTDEIINHLSSINDLSVIARQSAARLKREGMDIHQIGKELGVEYILDASVHWRESSTGLRRVRLVTQLIKVSDESVIWGKTYDTVITEVFEVQSDMAQQVAENLGVILTNDDKEAVWAKFTNSDEAWDFFLRGNSYHSRGSYGIEKDLRLALEMYRQAIRIDSTFGRVYSMMSQTYSRLYFYYCDHTDSCKAIAKAMAEKAIELSPLHPHSTWGHFSMSQYYYRCERDYEKALKEQDIACADYGGRENFWSLNTYHQILRRMGSLDDAYEHGRQALELEPRLPWLKYDLAHTCEYMRKYEEAENLLRGAFILRPDWFDPYINLAWMYLNWQGDTDKAREVIRESWGKVDTTSWIYLLQNLDILDGDYQSALVRVGRGDYSTKAWVCKLEEKTDSAMIYFDSARIQWEQAVKRTPDFYSNYEQLGRVYARLGNHDLAMANIRRAMEIMPLSRDALDGSEPMETLYSAYLFLGELDSALVQCERLLKIPCRFDLGTVLIDPDAVEFIKHPGFAHLVEEYGNEYHQRLYENKVSSL